MMKQAELDIRFSRYGDVCKRSHSDSFDDVDLEQFENELLEAIAEEIAEME